MFNPITMAYEFDDVDVKILNVLQQNARLSHKKIAGDLNRSLNTIYNRINRLEDTGIINNYVALLNPAKVERGLIAFTHVQLKDHSESSLGLFEAKIVEADEVMECYHMSGDYDFILKVATKDMNTYHDFLMNKLFKVMAIGSVQSTFVMKQAKFETAYVLEVANAK